MVYLWSTWWFTIWCVIQSGPVFFVGQAAYDLGWTPLKSARRRRSKRWKNWQSSGGPPREITSRRMATSRKKTLFELFKRGSKCLPNPFFLVPRLSGKQWFFSCPKGLEDPPRINELKRSSRKKSDKMPGWVGLNGSFPGERNIHSRHRSIGCWMVNRAKAWWTPMGSTCCRFVSQGGLDAKHQSKLEKLQFVSGWRWLHVWRFDWEHIWPFQLIYAYHCLSIKSVMPELQSRAKRRTHQEGLGRSVPKIARNWRPPIRELISTGARGCPIIEIYPPSIV